MRDDGVEECRREREYMRSDEEINALQVECNYERRTCEMRQMMSLNGFG